jgi:hypothetical protein
MSNFIFEANMANYEKLLATETDPKKIAIMRNYWQKKKPNCPTGALKMKTEHSKMRSPQWAALLAPSAGTALAFEHPDCPAGSGLKHLVNQARLSVAFDAAPILTGFFTR